MIGSLIGIRTAKREAALAARHPGEPWKWQIELGGTHHPREHRDRHPGADFLHDLGRPHHRAVDRGDGADRSLSNRSHGLAAADFRGDLVRPGVVHAQTPAPPVGGRKDTLRTPGITRMAGRHAARPCFVSQAAATARRAGSQPRLREAHHAELRRREHHHHGETLEPSGNRAAGPDHPGLHRLPPAGGFRASRRRAGERCRRGVVRRACLETRTQSSRHARSTRCSKFRFSAPGNHPY